MAGRKIPLVNGEYYHIFNRGITGQLTYLNKTDYEQKLLCLSYYRFNNLPLKLSRLKELSVERRSELLIALESKHEEMVTVLAYVLMPNHFHLILRQNTDNGISSYLSKITNSYTRYFNTRHERRGDLYQGIYKAVYIEDNEQLLHVSRYIHLNPVVSFVVKEKDFLQYPYSSLSKYLQSRPSFIDTSIIGKQFSSPNDYQNFILDRVNYAKRLNEIKHLVLE